MATAAEKDRAKKGIKARQDAVAFILSKYKVEFDELHMKNRLALGLPAKPQGATRDQIEAKIERAKKQMEKWQEELRIAS